MNGVANTARFFSDGLTGFLDACLEGILGAADGIPGPVKGLLEIRFQIFAEAFPGPIRQPAAFQGAGCGPAANQSAGRPLGDGIGLMARYLIAKHSMNRIY